MNKLLLFILLGLLQSACGFRPVYKTDNINLKQLAAIYVEPITTIEGTYFYNHLRELLPPLAQEVKYILTVKLSFFRSYNIIQSNSDILRETQNITVNYSLKEKSSAQKVTEGSFTKMNSYSINFPAYSNMISRQEAVNILAQDAATEIRNRLIMFLTNLNQQNL